jgi:hypothetical protein
MRDLDRFSRPTGVETIDSTLLFSELFKSSREVDLAWSAELITDLPHAAWLSQHLPVLEQYRKHCLDYAYEHK